MKKKIYTIVFSICLIAFTGYVLLDTFLLTEALVVVEEEQTPTIEKPKEEEIVIKDDYYKDENIEIKISKTREYNTDIHIADVKIKDISFLKTAFAKNTYGKNVTEYTSKTAAENQAILAINGDYYGVQEKGYVLKNYKIYRKTTKSDQEDLVIYKNGLLDIITEKETALESLEDAKEVLSFGPALVLNNEVVVGKRAVVQKELASNPRTAIAMIEPYHYLFVVSDGRTNVSEGLSLYELATVLEKLNAKTAYNLDGGGSSTLYFNGKIINNPMNKGKPGERKVSDIVYIGY